MSLRVKKELERIYEGLLSVTVVCLCHVKKAGAAEASESVSCAAGAPPEAGPAIARVKRHAKSHEITAHSALIAFRKFLGSIPRSVQIIQSVPSIHIRISCAEFVSFTFHKEHILEADDQKTASMPFSARRRRFVRLRKTGLDAPCATVNLARDALDESSDLMNAAAVA